MNSALGSLLNGVSAVAVGAYFAAVIYQGNAEEFISEAATDWRYIEFLLALVAIKLMLDIPFVGDAVFWIVLMAIIAVGLKIVSNTGSMQAFEEFGNGEIGMFETVTRIFAE